MSRRDIYIYRCADLIYHCFSGLIEHPAEHLEQSMVQLKLPNLTIPFHGTSVLPRLELHKMTVLSAKIFSF